MPSIGDRGVEAKRGLNTLRIVIVSMRKQALLLKAAVHTSLDLIYNLMKGEMGLHCINVN